MIIKIINKIDNTMEISPQLVIFEIGLRLDYQSLKKFQQSNKTINNVIKQRYFWEQKIYIDYRKRFKNDRYEPKERYYCLLAREKCFPGAERYTRRSKCLIHAIEKGEITDVDYFLELYRDRKIPADIFEIAGKSCNELIISKLWIKVKEHNISLYQINSYERNLAHGVGKSGNLLLIESYLRSGEYINAIMNGASKANHKFIVASLLDQFSNIQLDRAGLMGATIGGNFELLVNLIEVIKPHPVYLNILLRVACKQNNLNIIKLLIKTGATNYANIILGSISNQNVKFIQWGFKIYKNQLLTMDFNSALKFAYSIGNLKIIDLLFEFIQSNQITVNINYALYGACTTANIQSLKNAVRLQPTDWDTALHYFFQCFRYYPKRGSTCLNFILANRYVDINLIKTFLLIMRLNPSVYDTINNIILSFT